MFIFLSILGIILIFFLISSVFVSSRCSKIEEIENEENIEYIIEK